MAAIAPATIALAIAAPLCAQVSVRLGGVRAGFAGAGDVSAVQIAPRYDWAHTGGWGSVDASWAQFQHGGWAAQFNALEAHTSTLHTVGVVLGGEGLVALNAMNGGIFTGGLSYVVGIGRRFGSIAANLGYGLGVARDTAGTYRFAPPFRLGVGWRGGALSAAIKVQGITRNDSLGYTDGELDASYAAGLLMLSAGSGWRVFDRRQPRAVWHAQVVAQPSAVIGIELAGGRYPRSIEGFNEGNFVTAGVRLTYAPRVPRPAISRTSAGTRVDFAIGGREVSIAGDWNDWTPVPMTKGADGRWSAVVPVTSGAHKFALTVDGKTVVPRGVPKLPDGFGGEVGLLVIS